MNYFARIVQCHCPNIMLFGHLIKLLVKKSVNVNTCTFSINKTSHIFFFLKITNPLLDEITVIITTINYYLFVYIHAHTYG